MAKKSKTPHPRGKSLRSQLWFDNPDNPGMTALYLERYLNYGLTLRGAERPASRSSASRRPAPTCRPATAIISSSPSACARASATAGGIAFEFPCIRSRKPASGRPRRSTAISPISGLVEVLYGYPLDGVVLTTGCDKTTPACIMAAATVNIPAIVLSGGPMLNGWWKGERSGSGTVVWKARQELAAGRIDYKEFLEIVASSAPSIGHCNTMGTASTMNALAEALGMSLPGCAAIPAPYNERAADRL